MVYEFAPFAFPFFWVVCVFVVVGGRLAQLLEVGDTGQFVA